MTKQKRVLLLGLDGVTWRLLEPMMGKGLLPNLARLRKASAWGELESTIPPVTAAAWTTFQTGVLPGKHGTVDFSVYTRDSYRTHPTSSADIPLSTLWERLSAAGKKVVTVNVPITYPPRAINGCAVSGMLTPNLEVQFTYPPELADEIRQRFPGYTILTPQTVFNTSNLGEFINRCVETEQERARVFAYLLREQCPDWDVAMFHVQELDVVQHAVYWWLDEGSPHFDPEQYPVAMRAYQAVDEILGQIVDLLTDNTLLIVLSDHGHGPIYRTVNTNSLLAREGLVAFNRSRSSSLLRRAIGLALRLDRWNLNRKLGRKRRRELVDRLNQQVAVDWTRTKAFMINGWVWANIYVNVKGRDPQGLVKPGDEYEQVRHQLIDILTNLRDPETDQAVIEKVLLREEAFPGADGPLPDVIGIPVMGYEFSSSFYHDVDEVFWSNRIKRDHTGSHTLDGILIATGSMVRPGLVQGARLVDLFPTILAWLDLPIPAYSDGQVLQTAFTQGLVPVVEAEAMGAAVAIVPKGDSTYSEAETAEIEDRLRALGYM